MARDIPNKGTTSPDVSPPDGVVALLIAGAIGGSAPYLLRIALHLWKAMESSEAIKIPQASVWMGIAIFGVLGLGIAFIFADRQKRAYFAAAMMTPALITNATIGLDNAGKEKADLKPQVTGLAFVGSALAQDQNETVRAPSTPSRSEEGRRIQLRLNLQDVPTTNADQLTVTVPGEDDAMWSQSCPIAQATTCSVFMPLNADELKLTVGGVDQTIDVPDTAGGVQVGLTGQPTVAQQLWFALGGTLTGNVTGIEAQAIPAQ